MSEWREVVMQQVAHEFFSRHAFVKTGVYPDPWVWVEVGSTQVTVQIPHAISDEDFEAEVRAQFDRLMRDLNID